MMNIMGIIPLERHVGIEVSARHAQIKGVHRVPQGEEEQNHHKKLWESSYKNNFAQYKKHRKREGQRLYHSGNPVDVLELSQEALELFWGDNTKNRSGTNSAALRLN